MPRVRELLFDVDPYHGFDPSGFELDLRGWNSTPPLFERLIRERRPQTIIEVATAAGAADAGGDAADGDGPAAQDPRPWRATEGAGGA